MPRLIDADELLCYIADEISISREEREDSDEKGDTLGMAHNNGEIQEARRIMRHINENVSIIDAEPVRHGRWEHFNKHAPDAVSCSVCDYPFARLYPANYCPNCGAQMDLKNQ